jgi:hypothetical protein
LEDPNRTDKSVGCGFESHPRSLARTTSWRFDGVPLDCLHRHDLGQETHLVTQRARTIGALSAVLAALLSCSEAVEAPESTSSPGPRLEGAVRVRIVRVNVPSPPSTSYPQDLFIYMQGVRDKRQRRGRVGEEVPRPLAFHTARSQFGLEAVRLVATGREAGDRGRSDPAARTGRGATACAASSRVGLGRSLNRRNRGARGVSSAFVEAALSSVGAERTRSTTEDGDGNLGNSRRNLRRSCRAMRTSTILQSATATMIAGTMRISPTNEDELPTT